MLPARSRQPMVQDIFPRKGQGRRGRGKGGKSIVSLPRLPPWQSLRPQG